MSQIVVHTPLTRGCLGLILFSLLLAACSKEYDGKTEGISFLINPLKGETGVDPGIVVRAVFNRDIFGPSINNSSLTLNSPSGGVAGSVSFDGQYNRVSFTSATELTYSTTYNANLSNSITDLRGNPVPGYGWSFTTRGGGWGSSFLLEHDNTGDAFYPVIAMDNKGNAMAVWRQITSVYDIWASRYTAGKGWGAPVLIETDNSGNASNPNVALDNSGNALAVWSQFDGSRDNIWANHYTEGSGWGTAVKIETEDLGTALLPQIVFDTSGNAIAVWHQSDGTRYNIWANRYTPGSGWGAAEKLETYDNYDAYNPKIAIDSNGNAIAVWQQQEDGASNINIWTNRYTAGSGWGVAEKIDTEDLGTAEYPEIAVDKDGNAIAVWHQSDGVRNNIWANRYTAGSGWGSPAKIETDDTLSGDFPQIAFDSNGNAIAVWYQISGTDILANRYVAGSGWGTAQVIDADTGSVGASGANPKIGFDSNGRAIVVWSQSWSGTGTYYIWSNRIGVRGVWGVAEKVETNDLNNSYYPNIAVDGNSGNAIVVWYQFDANYNIYANHFTR